MIQVLNEDATVANVINALKLMIDASMKGDELVFQYSGHGTQVYDENHDEADLFDEAVVHLMAGRTILPG